MALALTAAMGAQLVAADAPPGPTLPITSAFTVGKNAAGENVVTVCVKPNEDISGGPIHDVDFLESPWPDPNQPKENFVPPPGWQFESVPGAGWRASSSTPMTKGQEYCFVFPVNLFRKNPGNVVTLIATNKTHNAIANFISTLEEKKALNRLFTLGPGPDRGAFSFQPGSNACNARSFMAPVTLQADRSGNLTITPPAPAQPASGRLFSNGTFAAGNATEGWIGGIRRARVLFEYRVVLGRAATGNARTSQANCTATFIGQGTLDRPGHKRKRRRR
jgi:hypothetical protein